MSINDIPAGGTSQVHVMLTPWKGETLSFMFMWRFRCDRVLRHINATEKTWPDWLWHDTTRYTATTWQGRQLQRSTTNETHQPPHWQECPPNISPYLAPPHRNMNVSYFDMFSCFSTLSSLLSWKHVIMWHVFCLPFPYPRHENMPYSGMFLCPAPPLPAKTRKCVKYGTFSCFLSTFMF